MKQYGQEASLQTIQPAWQFLRTLMKDRVHDTSKFVGDVLDAQSYAMIEKHSVNVFIWANFYHLAIAYTLGDYDTAERCSRVCESIADFPFGATDTALMVLFDGLVALSPHNRRNRKWALNRAKDRLAKLETWSQHSPLNFLGKSFLLQASIASYEDDPTALAKFTCAIALSREAGFGWQTALSNELLAQHLVQTKERPALPYVEAALEGYEAWGSPCKVHQVKYVFRSVLLEAK